MEGQCDYICIVDVMNIAKTMDMDRGEILSYITTLEGQNNFRDRLNFYLKTIFT